MTEAAADAPSGDFPGAPTPSWRRAGAFVFLGTHTPHRPEDGALVRTESDLPSREAGIARGLKRGNLYVDVLRGPIVAQTAMTIANLAGSLAAAGSGLDRVIHLRLFIHDRVDELFVLQTVLALFDGKPPSGEIVVARNAGSDPAIGVHADALAFATDSPDQIERVVVPGREALTWPFPTFTRAGPYIFTSCFGGRTLDGARAVADAGELDAPERALIASFGALPNSQRPFILQQAAMWGHARRLFAELGADLEHVFYHLAWLRISMRQLGNGSVTRLVSPLVREYCLTCFPVAGLRDPAGLIEGRYVALAPGAGLAKSVKVPIHGISNSYFGAIQAGDLLVAAGEVPIDTRRQVIVARAAENPARRGAEFGLVHRDRRMSVEADYVYGLIGDTLKAYGLGYGDLQHQSLYLCDAAEHPAALAALALRSPARDWPATSAVPIEGASPFADTRLEVEFMASAARPRAAGYGA